MNSHEVPCKSCVLYTKCLLNLIYLKQNTYNSMELYFEEKLLTSFLEAGLQKFDKKALPRHNCEYAAEVNAL